MFSKHQKRFGITSIKFDTARGNIVNLLEL